jgi:hypothetical protein
MYAELEYMLHDSNTSAPPQHEKKTPPPFNHPEDPVAAFE